MRAHRQAWCWQDEYQGLTLADIRRLEDETQRELNKRMANFQNQNLLSVANINSDDENVSTNTLTSSNEINQPLSVKRNRQVSIDNINANRSRINSFPVPPLPRDETPDDEYFDAECKSNHHLYSIVYFIYLAHIEGVSASRSLRNVRRSTDDNTTISSIDDDERTFVSLSSDEGNNKCSNEFLILIFYGGM